MKFPSAPRPAPAFFAALALFAALVSAAEFRLDDGTTLQGDLVALDDSTAVIRNPTLGEVRVPRSRVAEGLPADSGRPPALGHTPSRGRRPRDPAGYALMITPTAYTPEQGTVTFRDFELFFMNFGYSPTSTTVISGGFLFPISSSLQVLSLGIKQQLFASGSAALAMTGNVTLPFLEDEDDEEPFYSANLVLSKRFEADGHDDALGLHTTLGTWGVEGEQVTMLGLGAEARLGRNAKLLVEYIAPLEYLDAPLVTLAVRLHSESLSADIGGLRPLTADGDFLFFPMLVINYRW